MSVGLERTWPRILFVLGKGGVGRSTVSTALALALARRGERTLVFEWTIAEPIAPWFGLPAAGPTPVEVSPGVSVATYRLDEALRAYFVDHLHLARFHRYIIDGPHVRRLVEAAPGFSELLFLGTLWWLSTVAGDEAGLRFDRIVVDAPATGHGASLLDMPETLLGMGASGLLGMEIDRVVGMMRDPAWSGAAIVATPEDLALDETAELLPRAARAMGRPPIAAFINRAVARVVDDLEQPAWKDELDAQLSPRAREGMSTLWSELRARTRCEVRLRELLSGETQRGSFVLDDQLLASGTSAPREVVLALTEAAGACL